jgi:hypothetical protein
MDNDTRQVVFQLSFLPTGERQHMHIVAGSYVACSVVITSRHSISLGFTSSEVSSEV